MSLDLDLLRLSIPQMAEERGLRLIEDALMENYSVVLGAETVSIKTALAIARDSFAPFVSLSVERFSIEEEIEELGGADSDGAQSGIRLLRRDFGEHDGDVSQVDVSWVAQGATFHYLATTDWLMEFREQSAQLLADERVERQAQRLITSDRIEKLAELLEAEPEFRRTTVRTRTAVGQRLLAKLKNPGDDEFVLFRALADAKLLLIAGSDAAYAEIEPRVPEVARDLAKTDEWATAYRVAEREAVTADYLLGLTGGYAPSTRLVGDVRRAAQVACEKAIPRLH